MFTHVGTKMPLPDRVLSQFNAVHIQITHFCGRAVGEAPASQLGASCSIPGFVLDTGHTVALGQVCSDCCAFSLPTTIPPKSSGTGTADPPKVTQYQGTDRLSSRLE
jgi:hypothetical protein